MASANTLFKSHEDYRRNRELEEARKAGIAPAAVDEEGKEINPHIPQYMSSAPWYLNDNRPSLKHQKDWRERPKDEKRFYDRGAKVFQANKYRKGACENCGAMTHKTKDCLERPRTKGAKFTNKHIAADEKVESLDLDTFEAKRDRWNGYDTADYATRVVDLHEKVEEAKREAKKQQAWEKAFTGKAGERDSDDSGPDEDDDKIMEEEEAGFNKLEKRVRTTGGGASGSVRNLRIREDTAKYLLNLDPNSAHYDPKSRSMRADPQPHKPANEKAFMGDNFVRQSGDFHDLQALTMHAISAQNSASEAEIHPQAAPSEAEALHRTFKIKREQLAKQSKGSVKEKYGDAGLQPSAEEASLLLGQTEGYVEYNAQGKVIKGEEAKARSRYEEDVFPNNHTSVWGSWWKDDTWGYACCHQTVKNSYCTGTAGEHAAEMSLVMQQHNLDSKAAQAATTSAAVPKGNAVVEAWGTDVAADLQLNKEKLAAELKKQEIADRRGAETDERKRKYNSMAGQDTVTAEEMEAYRLRKARADDPLQAAAQNGAAANSGYDFV